MGGKKPTVREEENPGASQVETKSNRKVRVIYDDEYAIGVDLSEDQQNAGFKEQNHEDVAMATAGKKKGKKGSSKSVQVRDEEQDKLLLEDDEEVAFMGKKKSKSKKGGNNVFSSSNFNVLKEEEDDKDIDEHKENEDCDGEDRPVFPASAFDALAEGDGIVINEPNQQPTDGDEIENNDTLLIAFSSKKKTSKSKKFSKSSIDTGFGEEEEDALMGKKKSKSKKGDNNVFSSANFNVLKEEDDDKDIDEHKENDNSDGEDRPMFPASAFDALCEGDGTVFNEPDQQPTDKDEIESNDAIVIAFSGKKKSSNSSYDMGIGDEETSVSSSSNMGDAKNVASAKTNKQGSDDIMESSKNKKKKKKGGRSAQVEDDLYKILAELGEGPSLPKPSAPPSEKKVTPHLEEAEVHHTLPEEVVSVVSKGEEKEAEEIGDSAAAKKKRKKEKEKERKAAAAAADMVEVKEKKEEETKTCQKISKHVREIQEVLARRKEAEERKKREEEERSRKEEEERRWQEELERLAVETRRRKKEREKKKLLKKKQEGKPSTRKQKEGARKLEAKRKQFISQGGADNACGPTKQNQETAAEDTEADKVQEVEQQKFEEKVEDPQVVEENGVGEEEEDEWDAKSWDDVTEKLSVKSAFDEEESECVVKREAMHIASPVSVHVGAFAPESETTVSNKKVIPPSHMKNQNLVTKVEHPEVQVMDNNGKKDSAAKKEARHLEAISNRSPNNLRSPICCIMGHVDTGKTKLLDCIRGTNVQLGEAGGITQQIGATYFPAENIRERTKELKADAKLRVPGLLVIDTPGHESFSNLRSRGSGLCDIAVLVVDIMHGLEPQTIESLNLLKMRNTEFIVALNKVDRLYGWKTCPNAPIQKALKQQSNDVQNEFKMRLTQIVTQFKEQGMNTELYYKNREMGETFSIVPTSAISGEGIPDLLLLLVQWTSKTMVEKLMFSNEVQCTVLEVKVVEGLGTTIDVVLVNGVLHEGDQIVVCGMQGPILTTIRALLTPHPMKEIRVKGHYLQHKVLKAAQGVKIAAHGLEHAIAGTGLYVVGPDDSVEDIKEAAMQDMRAVMSKIDKSGEGVSVQASTLGSLEALLEFLKSPVVNIPVSGISIGPVHKKDVMRASVMLEKKKEYATILAFDVKVTQEARELAEETGVKIFNADIIYHLFDQFKHYIENLKEEKKKEAAEAVFPCVLQIFPNCIFNKKDPIILGVDVVEGIAKVGTPICIPSRDFIEIGRISSIEINHKQVDVAKKGSKIAIKIASTNAEEQQKMFGKHFDEEDELVSHLTRRSIDVLKANYRDKLSIDEWRLVVKLKNLFGIQ